MTKSDGSGHSGKRRDKGDGSLYFRKSESRWIGSFYLEDGTRKYIAGAVGGTKKEAKTKLEEAMEQARRGELVASSSQTLTEYIETWLEEKRLELKDGTYPTWKNYLDVHVISALGSWPLQKLKRDHIQKWVNSMCKKDLQSSTIHLIYNIFKLAMKDAVARQCIGVTPCKDITLPRIEDREMQVLDPKQARTFLSWLSENDHKYQTLYTLAINTGMRQGELLALRWSDLDLNKGTVSVRRSVKYINNVGFKENEPKTKGSKRTIILTDSAIRSLRMHHAAQMKERMHTQMPMEKNLVFCNPQGEYQAVTSVTRGLKRSLKLAGLPEIRFHDLRHTAATLLLRSGASLKSVQKTLGHSNIQTTMRYLHLLPEMAEQDMQRLNNLLVG